MSSDSESVKDQTILDLTQTPCGICGPSTQDEEMVGCDGCSGWFHIRCVGIEAGKLPKKWYCQSKACQEKAQEYRNQKQKYAKKKTGNPKQGNEFDKFSTASGGEATSVEARVKALEERQKRELEKLEAEMLLRKKEKEMKRAFERKKMEMEEQMRAEEEEEQMAWEAEMLRKKKEQIERAEANRKSFEEKMAAMNNRLAQISGGMRAGPSGIAKPLALTKENLKKLAEEEESEYSEDEDYGAVKDGAKKEVLPKHRNPVDNVSQDGLGRQQVGPTRAQLAARKGLTYKLPKFSGKPAQWPLFYAAYNASNDACGYMNHENLMRLHEALEGDALELVSGQLLLPESIPRVIEKLQRHYGRPEQLLESLLDKVNRLEPPKPDNLRSFVPFGNTVEQLCGHLEAAGLRQHLVNPLLLKSLVAKLPDREKREWVHYRRRHGEATLRTLTDFLMDIVADACEANVDVEFKPAVQPRRTSQAGKNKSKENGALYCHDGSNSSPVNTNEEKRLKPCKQCRGTDHRLRHCAEFKKLRYAERVKLANREKLCHVCLNEHTGQCKFKIRCNVGECREFHVENPTCKNNRLMQILKFSLPYA